MKWKASGLLIPSAHGLLFDPPRYEKVRQVLAQHYDSLRQEMSSLEMQKPSLRAGRPSRSVGCISGISFVLWAPRPCLTRKQAIPPTQLRMEPGKQISRSGCQWPAILIWPYQLTWTGDTEQILQLPASATLPSALQNQMNPGHQHWLVGGMCRKHFLLLGILAFTVIYLGFSSSCCMEGWRKKWFPTVQADHPEKLARHTFSIGLKYSLRPRSWKTNG